MKKILIAEDEDTLRGVLVDMINRSGFLTLEAGDGEEGLKKALSEHPDLILLDILMPKMDGLTMLKKLREDVWGKNVPVIILTNVDPDDRQLKEILEYKASYYLIKTKISMENIMVKIQELFEAQLKLNNKIL